MFEKVTAKNIDNVKKGDVLVKYPAFGEPVEKVDEKDIHNNVVLRVQIIIGRTVAFLLVGSTIPANLPGMSYAGPLRIEKPDLVSQNAWWFYKQEISN